MNKTNDIKQKVLEEYKAGAKATDLAAKYGISRGTLYLWINNEKKGKLSFKDERNMEVIRLFTEEHKSATELATQFDIPVEKILLWTRYENKTEEQIEEEKSFSQERHDNFLLEKLRQQNEEIKRLREEVELYKSLLTKLNTLIDNQDKEKLS